MINLLQLTNFKSFGKTGGDIPLGPLTLIAGTNASGKSNIRDALRFLHGVSRGYSLAEILGEKYGQGGERIWDGIRGGIREVVHVGGEGAAFILRAEVSTSGGRLRLGDKVVLIGANRFSYSLAVGFTGNSSCTIIEESLERSGKVVFSTMDEVLRSPQSLDLKRIYARAQKPGGKKYIGNKVALRRDQPLVTQLADDPEVDAKTRALIKTFLRGLESFRFLDLDPGSLRRPSLPGQTVFGDKGENLSSVLQAVCEDPKRKEALIEWTRELTPLDVVDFEFPQVSLDGKVQAVLVESKDGRRVSAESASDGTLRFLAYAAAMLGTNPADFYFFEELENGIHPNRIHLLLELMNKATSESKTQVVATTHSPALFNSLRGKPLQDALVVTRQNGNSHVRRFKDLPINEADKHQTGELLESGWFENVATYLDSEEKTNR